MSGPFSPHLLLPLCYLLFAATTSAEENCQVALEKHKIANCCPRKPTSVSCTSTSENVYITFSLGQLYCSEGKRTIKVGWQVEGEEEQELELPDHAQHHAVSGIKPWTEVRVSVAVAYSHDEFGVFAGEQASTSCKTKPGRPTPPRNLKVVSIAEGKVSVSWEAPEEENGPLEGYLVDTCDVPSCQRLGLSRCTGEKAENRRSTSRNLTRLQKMEYCQIRLSAYNVVDGKVLKSELAQVCVKSPPKPPAAADLKLECTAAPNTLKATWPLGESPWDSYKLQVEGPRVGSGEDSEITDVDTWSQCTKREGCRAEFKDVKGGRTYVVTVWPHIEYVPLYEGSKARKECTVPASAPPQPEKEIEIKFDTPHQPMIRITRDAFSDANGVIMDYTVLVAQDQQIGDCKNPVHWKEASTSDPVKCYIACKIKADPDAPEGSDVRLTLGNETGCGEGVCNGPLKNGTKYGVIVRASTAGGSTDSKPRYFVTGSGQEVTTTTSPDVTTKTSAETTTGPKVETTTGAKVETTTRGNGSRAVTGSVLVVAVALLFKLLTVW